MTEVLGPRRTGRADGDDAGHGRRPDHERPGRRPALERPRPGVPPHIRRRRARFAIAIILLLAITIGAIGWWLGSGRWTVIPDLLGAEQGAAIDLLQEAGLTPTAARSSGARTLPAGAVISADPAAGEAIRGTDVPLVVSKGPERFQVDTALVAQPWAEVEKKLQESLPEIAFTTTEQHDNEIPAGLGRRLRSAGRHRSQAGPGRHRDRQLGHAPVAVPDVTGQSRAGPSNLTARLHRDRRRGRAHRGRRRRRSHGRDPGPADGPQPFGSAVDDHGVRGPARRWRCPMSSA